MHDETLDQAPKQEEFEEVGMPETELVEASEAVVSNAELEALASEGLTQEPEETPQVEQVVSPEVEESAIDAMSAGIEALVFASCSSLSCRRSTRSS